MQCFNCKKEITRVVVCSKCWHTATVDTSGIITSFGLVESDTIGESQYYVCPDCGKIIDGIKEK